MFYDTRIRNLLVAMLRCYLFSGSHLFFPLLSHTKKVEAESYEACCTVSKEKNCINRAVRPEGLSV